MLKLSDSDGFSSADFKFSLIIAQRPYFDSSGNCDSLRYVTI